MSLCTEITNIKNLTSNRHSRESTGSVGFFFNKTKTFQLHSYVISSPNMCKLSNSTINYNWMVIPEVCGLGNKLT